MPYEAKDDFTAVEDTDHLVSGGFVVVDLEQLCGVSVLALTIWVSGLVSMKMSSGCGVHCRGWALAVAEDSMSGWQASEVRVIRKSVYSEGRVETYLAQRSQGTPYWPLQ